jgi:hypothetical protein
MYDVVSILGQIKALISVEGCGTSEGEEVLVTVYDGETGRRRTCM